MTNYAKLTEKVQDLPADYKGKISISAEEYRDIVNALTLLKSLHRSERIKINDEDNLFQKFVMNPLEVVVKAARFKKPKSKEVQKTQSTRDTPFSRSKKATDQLIKLYNNTPKDDKYNITDIPKTKVSNLQEVKKLIRCYVEHKIPENKKSKGSFVPDKFIESLFTKDTLKAIYNINKERNKNGNSNYITNAQIAKLATNLLGDYAE